MSRVGEWAAGVRDVPGEVLDRALWALRDTAAVMIAGTGTAAAQAAARTARRTPGTVRLFAGGTASAPAAAMANAVAASALDFDDGHYRGGGIHPGSTVVPALLAVAGERTTADEFLLAQIVGYEVAIRAGYLLAPAYGKGNYRCSGAATALGAAVAVAKLLGLDGPGIERALRIASAHAPVATLQLPMVKESIGWAAATGVTAAWLAQDGFDDGPVADAVLGIPATPFDGRLDAFGDSFGRTWESANCYVKAYPSCRAAHAAIDAALGLRITASVSSVLVETIAGAAVLDDPAPRTLEEAQFSIPHALASALLGVGLWPPAPAAADLAARVTVRAADDLADDGTGYPARVTVTTAAGSQTAAEPRARPLSEPDLRAKIVAAGGPGLLDEGDALLRRLLSDS